MIRLYHNVKNERYVAILDDAFNVRGDVPVPDGDFTEYADGWYTNDFQPSPGPDMGWLKRKGNK